MRGTDELYFVNDVYLSIQGEGALTGTPMVILRLQGCTVGCPWCDTKETWEEGFRGDPNCYPVGDVSHWLGVNAKYGVGTAREVLAVVVTHFPNTKWVLLTGGEPGERPCAPLCCALQLEGRKVAVETSGTAVGVLGAVYDHACVSPKLGMPGGRTMHATVVRIADEIKWPVGKQEDLDNLQQFLGTYTLKPSCRISLQPLSQSTKATSLCVAAAKEHDYCLSLQTHKFINLP